MLGYRNMMEFLKSRFADPKPLFASAMLCFLAFIFSQFLAPANFIEFVLVTVVLIFSFSLFLPCVRDYDVGSSVLIVLAIGLLGVFYFLTAQPSDHSVPSTGSVGSVVFTKRPSLAPQRLWVTGIYVDGARIQLDSDRLVWGGGWQEGERGSRSVYGTTAATLEIKGPIKHGHVDIIRDPVSGTIIMSQAGSATQVNTAAPQMGDCRFYFGGGRWSPLFSRSIVIISLALALVIAVPLSHVFRSRPDIISSALFASCAISTLLAEFPALMSPDNVDQYNQCTTGRFCHWQPLPHTLLIYLLRMVWNSPAILVLLHIGLFCLILIFVSRRYVIPRWEIDGPDFAPRFLLWLLCFNPAILIFMIWAATDTLFFECCILLLLLMEGTADKPARSHRDRLLLLGTALFCAFFMVVSRQNGILYGIVILMCFSFFSLGRLRPVRFALLFFIIFAVAQPFIYRSLKIPVLIGNARIHVLAIPLNQIASQVVDNSIDNAGTVDILHRIFDFDKLKRNYNAYDYASIMFNDSISTEALDAELRNIVTIWLRFVRSHFLTACNLLFKEYWVLISPFKGANPYYFAPNVSDSYLTWDLVKTDPQFFQYSLAPTFSNFFQEVRLASTRQHWSVYFYPALWIYISIGCLVISLFRRNRDLVRGTLAMLGGLILSAPLMPFPQLRFYWGFHVWALIALIALGASSSSKNRQDGTGSRAYPFPKMDQGAGILGPGFQRKDAPDIPPTDRGA